MCTFILAEELDIEVDVNRAVKIALVHDLAEAITGDIDSVLVAEGEISEEEKEEQEIKAIKGLEETLPEDIGEEISGLWHEYNDGKTPEAKFTKALDKIETLIQLIECGYEMYDKPGFIANYADKAVKAFPQLSPVLKIVKEKLKEEFKKGDIEWKEEYDYFD